jgi:hypothetical protein
MLYTKDHPDFASKEERFKISAFTLRAKKFGISYFTEVLWCSIKVVY